MPLKTILAIVLLVFIIGSLAFLTIRGRNRRR